MLQNGDNRLCNAEIGFFFNLSSSSSSFFQISHGSAVSLKAQTQGAKWTLDHVWAPGAHRHGEQVIFSVLQVRL
jgi:hypothetical protein